MSCMKEKKWYWEQKYQQQIITVMTRNIINTFIEVFVMRDIHDNPRGFCDRNQRRQALQRHAICLTESDHDYILDGILCRDKLSMKKISTLKII